MNKNKIGFIVLIFIVFLMASCTAGANDLSKIANSQGEIAGFWSGLWHGFILLFSFIISLFNENISVYEVHNSGALYNLGYLIGVSVFFSGSGSAGSKKRK